VCIRFSIIVNVFRQALHVQRVVNALDARIYPATRRLLVHLLESARRLRATSHRLLLLGCYRAKVERRQHLPQLQLLPLNHHHRQLSLRHELGQLSSKVGAQFTVSRFSKQTSGLFLCRSSKRKNRRKHRDLIGSIMT
jgi:hypothetical protein